MGKVLVSLVSDQTIPNVMLIKEIGVLDKYIFVSTIKMKDERKDMRIINGADLGKNTYEIIEVNENEFDSIEEKLNTLLQFVDFKNDTFYVNITGGNKIMSLATFEFFRNKNAIFYYIPFGKNTYEIIFPKNQSKNVSFEYKVNIYEYFKSYDVDIKNMGKLNTLIKSSDFTNDFFDKFINDKIYDKNIFVELRNLRDKNVPIEKIQHLANYFEKINIFEGEIPKIVPSKIIKYLTGEWFEEWVYNKIKTFFALLDTEIVISVQVSQIADNEFDVIFMYKNTIHLIECKTSVDKDLADKSINKLKALQDKFGSNVKSYLCCLRIDVTNQEQLDSIHNRAKDMKIKIIDSNILLNEQLFEEYLSKP